MAIISLWHNLQTLRIDNEGMIGDVKYIMSVLTTKLESFYLIITRYLLIMTVVKVVKCSEQPSNHVLILSLKLMVNYLKQLEIIYFKFY